MIIRLVFSAVLATDNGRALCSGIHLIWRGPKLSRLFSTPNKTWAGDSGGGASSPRAIVESPAYVGILGGKNRAGITVYIGAALSGGRPWRSESFRH